MSESRLSKRVSEYINDGKEGCVVKSIIEGLSGNEVKCYDNTCYSCQEYLAGILADAIDEEVDSARRIYMKNCMEHIAASEGWPTMRDGESVIEWVRRCWLPRPRYEDGEPVQWGDVVDGLDEPVDAMVVFDDGSGRLSNHIHTGLMVGPSFGQDSPAPIRRRMPKELGADGLPIVVGDTVWLSESHIDEADNPSYSLVGITMNESMTVIGFRFGRVEVNSEKGIVGYADSEFLTHNPPDTQQTIDDAATMAPAEYCALHCLDLGDDPDREKATTAMITDLLRRQRELDKRKG